MRRDSVAGVSLTAVSLARLRSVETVSARPSRLVASSKRRRGRASNWSGEGRARAAALSAVRLRSKPLDMQAFSRADRLASVASSSAFTGTAISAAPVGVGARTSAAWSISVQSVSWPTAEMIGIVEAATVRASASSLKPHRSSRLPPPRATMITSGRRIAPPGSSALKPATAAATSAPEVSPCTRTGQTMTCSGKRSLMRWMMSRITAPVGEVTTPITWGM